MHRTSLVTACAAIGTAALLAGCGSSSSGSTASAPTSAAAAATTAMPTDMPSMDMTATVSPSQAATDAAAGMPVVHIKDFAFSAPSTPIKAGEEFEVINDDSAAHTYEDVKGSFDSGNISGSGGMKMVKAPAAGTYQLKCDYHPNMHGTLTVAP